jgi:hypothetical protein
VRDVYRQRWKETLMNPPSFDRERDAHDDLVETEALSEGGFTVEEIACLLRLREWYQQGGSDRVALIHSLSFLKFLRSSGRLQS